MLNFQALLAVFKKQMQYNELIIKQSQNKVAWERGHYLELQGRVVQSRVKITQG